MNQEHIKVSIIAHSALLNSFVSDVQQMSDEERKNCSLTIFNTASSIVHAMESLLGIAYAPYRMDDDFIDDHRRMAREAMYVIDIILSEYE